MPTMCVWNPENGRADTKCPPCVSGIPKMAEQTPARPLLCLESRKHPYSIFFRWKIHQAVKTMTAMAASRMTHAQRRPSRGSFTFIP